MCRLFVADDTFIASKFKQFHAKIVSPHLEAFSTIERREVSFSLRQDWASRLPTTTRKKKKCITLKINIPSYFCIIFMFHSSDYLSCCAWVQLGGNCRDSWIFHLMIDSHAIHQRLCERYLSSKWPLEPRGVQRKNVFIHYSNLN